MMASVAGHALELIAPGLYRFDTGYLRKNHTAVYLLVDQGQVAILDTGVPANVPGLLEVIEVLGCSADDVAYVIPTHVHLDHAGGAGALMQALPQARLGVHPSGAGHMVDPSQLEVGVRALYGDAFFDREYTPVTAVAADRVEPLDDGRVLQIGGRTLEVIYTPGHAWHQLGLLDHDSGTFIAGDAFGAGYPGFGDEGAPFVVPVVPPPQFKPEAYRDTLARIVQCAPARVAPAHFPLITEVASVAETLEAMLDAGIEATWAADSVDDLERRLQTVWYDWLTTGADWSAYIKAYGKDIWLTAEGMWLWREKQR